MLNWLIIKSLSEQTKVQELEGLHITLPQDLQFFILLSSICGIIDLPGQANYAAGNTFLDSLARFRVSQGQKTVSIALGILYDDSFLAEDPELKKKTGSRRGEKYLAILDHFCDPRLPILNADDYNAVIGLQSRCKHNTSNRHLHGHPGFNPPSSL